jgi:WD40 repeat protein
VTASEQAVAIPGFTGPWKGLAPYDDTGLDEQLFFGREREVEVACANLTASRLTVLFGATGVGKSSLLRAGVIRRLREAGPSEGVPAIVASWSDDPVAAIAHAARMAVEDSLGRSMSTSADGLAAMLRGLTDELGAPLYLVLDQLEEQFLYHADEEGPGSFVHEFPALVTERSLPVHVLIGIREDSLGRLDTLRSAIPGVLSNYLRLERLDRDAARRAIVGPLDRWNELMPDDAMAAEPALVEAVLDEVAAGRIEPDPAGIGGVTPSAIVERIEAPYLQLVLERLWDTEREAASAVLQRETLRRLGGAGHIVEQHLDRSLAGLDAAERDAAAALFSYLVTPSGMKIAHTVDDLASYVEMPVASTSELVDVLIRERILRPAGGNRVEIYHDVLADAVADWHRDHDAARELEVERRRHRRLLVLLGVAVVALAAVAAVALYALAQRSEARRQADAANEQAALAHDRARFAHARELDAEATSQLPIDPELSLLLAAEAARLSPTAQAADVLRRALLVSKVRGVIPVEGVTTAEFSPDGERVVVGRSAGDARIFAADTRKLLATLRTGAPVTSATFSPNGQIVLTTEVGGWARLWRADDGKLLATIARAATGASFSPDGALFVTVEPERARVWRTADRLQVATFEQPGIVRSATFGPSGDLVTTVGSDRRARVFRADSGDLVGSFDQGGGVTSATITPNGRSLITTGRNGTARVWALGGSQRLLHDLKGHVGQVTAGVVDRRGKLLVTTSTDGSARIWTLPSGMLVTNFIGHTNQVRGAAFSRDGFSVVTWSDDRTARVWQPGRGAARALLAGSSDSVVSASFNPARKLVLTVSADGTAKIWDPQLQPELRPLVRLARPSSAAAIGRTGRMAAVAGPTNVAIVDTRDGRRLGIVPGHARAVAVDDERRRVAVATARRVVVWEVGRGRRLGVVLPGERPTAVAFSPDGGVVAVGTAGGSIGIWSLQGRPLRTIAESAPHVTGVAFSPNGDRLGATFAEGGAAVWRVRDSRRLFALVGHRKGAPILSIAFSPSGARIVTAGRDRDARIWNGKSGAPLTVLRGHFAVVSGASFNRDGRWVVTAGPGTAGLWDTAGERILFLRGHNGRLLAAGFDETANRIVTAGVDGTVRSYTCTICGGIGELLPLAERRLATTGRRLSAAEKRKYLRD